MRMIALYFEPEERGLPYGIYLITVYVGSSLASLTLLLTDALSWRSCFLVIALVSTAVCVLSGAFLKNAKNKKSDEKTLNFKEDFKELFKNKTIVLTIVATFARYASGFSRGYYEAIYLTDQFPNHKSLYSVLNAVSILLAPVSLVLAGIVSDKKESQDKPHWRPLICSFTNLVCFPLLIVMYTTSSFPLAMALLFTVYLVGETYISISLAMMINVTTPRIRGLRNY